ncbi:MAG: penicillin-binding protein [Lachnospiraceae bacterium]|nr:penicillin-binding protein [Lachnospiraceae bacterium]
MFFERFKEDFINFMKSRMLIPICLFLCIGVVLIFRIFNLQIIKGEEYVSNYELKIIREKSIDGIRGNIYDRNGVLLAYNVLSYDVNIEDIFESGKSKNSQLNNTIYEVYKLLEKNGDDFTMDFKIGVNEDDEYYFLVEGTQLQRFLADIYGHAKASDMSYNEKNSTPEDVINYFCDRKKYAIGYYENPNDRNSFVVGGGYTKNEIVRIISVRYALSLIRYQKYMGTTIASDISEKSVASILEHEDTLPGVSINQKSVRRYNDPLYFSQIIGYTGMISQEEYDEYYENDNDYSLNDYVGKTGIEYSQEHYLKGIKGKETVYVDVRGKVLDSTKTKEEKTGNDVYLTIDHDLQISIYHLLEQRIAGILVSKIDNIKEFTMTENTKQADIKIPIDDVYFQLINNNIIDLNHISKPYASETEQSVYNAFLSRQEDVFAEIRNQLYDNNAKAYRDLPKEYQIYQSFIVNYLYSDNVKIIDKELIDTEDEMYKAWTTEETISLKDYLTYCINMNWINVNSLDLPSKYADTQEIYDRIVDITLEKLLNNKEFSKKIYKFMIAGNYISGRDLCIILYDQNLIDVSDSEISALKSGGISSYVFMLDLIKNLKITPAQLALEPCSGSCVITDVNSGDVIALVSYPSYDNNRLANSDNYYLAQLNNDYSRPLWNYATQNKNAPGSTFKLISSVAGLSEGVIDLDTPIQCKGIFDKLIGSPHKCWIYPGAHGNLTVEDGIANSCNCFFYEVGYRLANDNGHYNEQLGMEKIYKYADMFGLSEKSGVEISESDPQVSDKQPVPSMIGQGTHAYTTVGLSRYVTAVANRGTVYNLTLIDKIYDSDGAMILDNSATVRNYVDLDPSVWNALQRGMRKVVERKVYYDYDLEVAGKTGTAQEAWNEACHAIFISYAPYVNPEISVTVKIMNGYDSNNAAQVAKDVYAYYYGLYDTDELLNGEANTPLNNGQAGD